MRRVIDYSAAGDRQAAELGKYRQQWEKLEGREPQRQQEQAAQKAASRSRRKIKAWSVEQDKEKILAELNEYLTEDRDRKLFNL